MSPLRTPRALVSCAVAAGAIALAGCGGDDEGPQIPRAQASALINRLEEAQRRSEPFRCNDLRRDTIPALETQLRTLPANLDGDVRQTLEDGIAHLRELVEQECDGAQRERKRRRERERENTTPTTPTAPTPTPAPTPEPTPTPTQPEPEPEPEPQPQPEPQPDNGGGGTPAPQDDGGGGAVAPGNGKNKGKKR